MSSKNLTKEEEFRDLGFGTKPTGGYRLINKQGRFTIPRKGQGVFGSTHIYDSLIRMKWYKFLALVIVSYAFINILFAMLYYVIGPERLLGIIAHNDRERFLECFYFSAQTITTVGYGRISPIGFLGSSLAALESLLGLLGFAVATGLLYGRFARPKAEIMYTDFALIAPYRNGQGVMFRLINKKRTQLIEIEVQLTLARNIMRDGKEVRDFLPLTLERSKINFLVSSWTLVHPLDEQSPLYGYTDERIKAEQCELIILLKAFHDSFGQTVYSRSSYRWDEIIRDAKFVPVLLTDSEGNQLLDVSKMNEIEYIKKGPQAAPDLSDSASA